MAKYQRAADLKGAEGFYIPDSVTYITINEMVACSTLQHMVNQEWNPEKLGLDCAPVAHYNILEPIDDMVFTRHQFNGERVGIPNPFRNGQIQMCHSYAIKEKFSRDEAIRQCRYWEEQRWGYEKAIAHMLRNMTESYGYRQIAASAAEYNQGNDAGKLSGNLKLGDTVNPLVVSLPNSDNVSDFEVSALEVVSRMVLAASEAGVMCGSDQMRMAASPRFVAKLMNEQAAHVQGCCVEKNPAVSGVLLPAYGLNVLRSHFFPTKRLADGRTVEYVIMVDPNLIVAPAVLDYLEWEKLLNDIYLIGNYRFDVSVLSGRGVVVAAVTFDK
ncbi:hypothetical protein [Neisseria animalis]|uniref:Capsid protein n=1 Tax=Neisseria animalis TaxID=492 RepID=A0A5P3MTJ8_NEIAN|nr:hypothetical protein [Neisseria animalis]QEY24790.1 hypothetical protein D0T90_10190 [Neisseria animalis]VEE07705.1 Uncharacterised protein [Neisseria animalis]